MPSNVFATLQGQPMPGLVFQCMFKSAQLLPQCVVIEIMYYLRLQMPDNLFLSEDV